MQNEARKLIVGLAKAAAPSSDHDLNPDVVLHANRELRPAAVLIALWERPDGVRVILTKRSSHLMHHPGQIAFPGGKLDPGDVNAEAAALRESHEEIGLPAMLVTVMGQLATHETVTGFSVTPILGYISEDFTPNAEAGEVDEVFTVPLHHLLSVENYSVEQRLWRGQVRKFYVVPYGPYYIWGATARILYSLARGAQP